MSLKIVYRCPVCKTRVTLYGEAVYVSCPGTIQAPFHKERKMEVALAHPAKVPA